MQALAKIKKGFLTYLQAPDWALEIGNYSHRHNTAQHQPDPGTFIGYCSQRINIKLNGDVTIGFKLHIYVTSYGYDVYFDAEKIGNQLSDDEEITANILRYLTFIIDDKVHSMG